MSNNSKIPKTAKQLVITAKGKEKVRLKLVETAKKLAATAKGKEKVRFKLVETAKKLAATAKEREKVRIKLAVMNEKLIIAEKFAILGKIVGIVNHELRNPLGVIRNSIFFLTSVLKENQDEKVGKHMDIINVEIDKCNKIITNSLDFARTKPPTIETTEINSAVVSILFRVDIPDTITVETKLGENLPKINIDITQITQVFTNLISNAIEAMPKGGKLKVTTSQTDAGISVAFKDTGAGISKENMNKLFHPLFSTKTEGLGLGLVACKNIIDAHHGKIECESKEGQGATFIVKLPIVQKVDTKQKIREELKN